MVIATSQRRARRCERGAAAVEFALIATAFLLLFLGIVEFGRLFYLYNTMQEATRNLARTAVVSSVSSGGNPDFIRNNALFGLAALPGGPEIAVENMKITYLTDKMVPVGALVDDQRTECVAATANCAAFVRVEINATYNPTLAVLFSAIKGLHLPDSTVIMPVESMGSN